MYFEFISILNNQKYVLISDITPSFQIGIYILIFSSIFLIYNFLKNLKNPEFNFKFELLYLILFYSGIFISTLFFIDEVFVNLEHPYNLRNHGIFSNSPSILVNGTVDYLLYLILTPFAFDRELLVISSYFLFYIIGILHLLVIYFYLKKIKISNKYFFIIIFFSYLPFSWLIGKGFGNSIISLIFLISLIYFLKSETKKSLLLASFFPLFRPDAILYSGVIFLINFLFKRKIYFKYCFILLFNFLLYFLITKFYYGHWVPTPMLLKSSFFELVSSRDLNFFFNEFLKLHNFLFFVFYLLILFFVHKNELIKKLLLVYPFIFCIFLFYSVNPGTQLSPRYSIGYFLFQILFFVLILCQQSLKIDLFNKFKFELNFNKYLTGKKILLITLVINLSILLPLNYIKESRYSYSRIDDLGVGGQFVDYVFPKNWKIAITELNTFGFMNDRDILDLWGFSNLDIAKSNIFSPTRNKINPKLFLKEKPDIYWFRTYNVNEANHSLALEIPEKRATQDNMSKSTNNLGDMLEVIKYYDMYAIYHEDYETILFAKKSLKSQIYDLLIEKNFSLKSSGSFDLDLFKHYYKQAFWVNYKG